MAVVCSEQRRRVILSHQEMRRYHVMPQTTSNQLMNALVMLRTSTFTSRHLSNSCAIRFLNQTALETFCQANEGQEIGGRRAKTGHF